MSRSEPRPALPENVRPLTGLRFFAALWVVGYDFWPNLAGVSFTPNLVAKGYLGVELFFVLSGFILSHVYLQPAGEGRFRYGGFLWARLARVYPLHLATLAWVAAMGVAALMLGAEIKHSVLAWSALPANLLMVHAWGFAPEAGWNHPSWSISAEWFAYLCFPAFAFVAWRLRARPNLAVGGALVLLFALYALFEATAGFPLTSATIRWGFLRIVPCFAYGCAIYLTWRAGLIRTRREAELGVLAFLGCIILACQLGAPDAAAVAAFGGLILTLAGLESAGSSWLTGRVTVYLGEISYGLYMVCIPWQMLYLNGVQKALHLGDRPLPFLLWLGLPAGAILAAIVAHHTVERPARVLMRRAVEHGWRGPRDETSRNPA